MSRSLLTRKSDGETIDLDLQSAEESDITSRAKRVILTDSDGTAFSSANPIPVDTEVSIGGAVELKDNDSDTRAEVDSNNALKVFDHVANSLVQSEYDYISLGYTGSNLTTVVFKTGGASGTTVSTLTLSYTGSRLDSVTKT